MAASDRPYDLIVAGGGPAGSSAARRAGKLGLRTLLLEKQAFPRYKPCGGALSEPARHSLDFELPAELCGGEIVGARAHFRGRSVEARMPYRLVTTVVRSAFDDLLLQKARETGIEARLGEEVLRFTDAADGVEAHTRLGSYRGKYLAIAEGAHGRLTGQVREKDGPADIAMCLVAEVPLDDETIAARFGGLADLYFDAVPGGYGWVFPHKHHLNIGLGGLADGLHGLKQRMAGFLAAQGFGGDIPLHAHSLPAGGKRRTLVRGRVLLCGDAAGFASAWTGEGMFYGIRSGQIAAEAVSAALAAKSGSDGLRDYAARCHRELWRDLRNSLFLAGVLHGFSGLMHRVLATNRSAFAKTLEIPAGRATHGQVLRWVLLRLPALLLGALRR